MTLRSIWKELRSNDAFVIVACVSVVVVGLLAFEQITGIPASVRGTPIYNVLPMPSSGESYNEEEEARIPTVSSLTKERVCDRIVRNFADDQTMWERVNKRVLERLGFRCSR